MEKVSGIYKIVNLVNGNCYIGSAENIANRFSQHKSKLNHNKHHSKHMQSAWNKYGSDAFEFLVLERCDVAILNDREDFYIRTEKPKYNTIGCVSRQRRVVTDEDIRRTMILFGARVPYTRRSAR